jgi:hypothetical protein
MRNWHALSRCVGSGWVTECWHINNGENVVNIVEDVYSVVTATGTFPVSMWQAI